MTRAHVEAGRSISIAVENKYNSSKGKSLNFIVPAF